MFNQKKINEATAVKQEHKVSYKSFDQVKKAEAKLEKQRQKQLAKEVKKTVTSQDCFIYQNLYENGLCEVGNGQWTKQISFSDLNYQIARPSDQENMFVKWCDFLNQISHEVNLQLLLRNEYIDQLQFQKQMLIHSTDVHHKLYVNEYNQMLVNKAQEGDNTIQRSHSILFGVKATNYDAALSLINRVEAGIDKELKSQGCVVTSLNGKERVDMLASYFRNTKLEFDYKSLLYSNLRTKDFIAPTSFNFKHKHRFKFGDKYGQVLFLRDLPTILNDQLVSGITGLSFPLDMSIHIQPIDRQESIKLVKRKIAFMDSKKASYQQKALQKGYDATSAIPFELQQSITSAYDLLDDIENRSQKMFDVCVLVYTHADSIEELENRVYQITSEGMKHSCVFDTLDYLQLEGINSILPIGLNRVPITRTMLTSALGVMLPFSAQNIYDKSGIYYGLNSMTKSMIFLDRIKLNNPNTIYYGTPGSGKSFAVKREIVAIALAKGDDIIIVDPEREYSAIVKALGGEIIELSSGSNNNLNPMEINDFYGENDDPVIYKSEFVLSLIEVILQKRDGLSSIEKSIIDRVTKSIYRQYYENNKTVTLKDLYNELKNQPEAEAKNIVLSLEVYVEGTLNTFAKESNIDTTNRIMCFDIKNLGKQIKSMGLLIVLDYIWNRITINRHLGKNTWIFIDELHILLRNEHSAAWLLEFWKRARKWGGVPTAVEQNADIMLDSEAGRNMLSNSDVVVMFNQASNDRVQLADLLKISETQLSYVTNSPTGHGLLYVYGAIIPFYDQFPTETKLYQLMTTKLSEQNEQTVSNY